MEFVHVKVAAEANEDAIMIEAKAIARVAQAAEARMSLREEEQLLMIVITRMNAGKETLASFRELSG